MSLLKMEPPTAVRTLDELFAMAEAMEKKAALRYEELAAQMRAALLLTVAEVFERLAVEERRHADRVVEWSQARTGAAPDPGRIRWQPPETFDEEEARAIGSSNLASAYRALSMAVRNEERAFALWVYIAAQSDTPAIQEAAERMAGEELRHAALLRRERRRAFHAERREKGDDGNGPRRPPAEEAAHIERALAVTLTEWASEPTAPAKLRHLADQSAGMTEEAANAGGDHHGGDRRRMAPGGAAPAVTMIEVLRLAERSVEAYLDAADAAGEEDAMRRMQSLAARAIARAASLRGMAWDR